MPRCKSDGNMAHPMKTDGVDWLYPDLLSKEGLLCILKLRYVRLRGKDLESLEKEELVELYNRYILPLPQRKYRNNRQGQLMTRKQLIWAKKRKRNISDDSDQPSEKKRAAQSPSSGLINHYGVPGSSGSRLKPPPSCINTDKKVVKLTSSKPSKNDNIVIKDMSKKTVKLNSTDKAAVPDQAGDGRSRKRKSENGSHSDDDSTEDAAKTSGPSPTKKKPTKITWP